MKRNHFYFICLIVSVVLMGVYFINPANPVLTLCMSVGASIIGAVILSVGIELIHNKKLNKIKQNVSHTIFSNLNHNVNNLFTGIVLGGLKNVTTFEVDSNKTFDENIIFVLELLQNNYVLGDLQDKEKRFIQETKNRLKLVLSSVDSLSNSINEDINDLLFNEIITMEEKTKLENLEVNLYDCYEMFSEETFFGTLIDIFKLMREISFINFNEERILNNELIQKLAKGKRLSANN